MPSAKTDVPVLIAGAGPTGLVLALWLTKKNIRVRVIDKTAEAGTTSRALVLHARTLEYYRQLGIADAVIAAGLKFTAANLWVHGERQGRVPLGDMGRGLSPYPYLLILPQDRHEQLLIQELKRLGVTVDRRTELVRFKTEKSGVKACLRKPDGSEEVLKASYLAGCDGAHSTVREILGIGFPGGTYPDLYYVADIEGEGRVMNGELHAALDESDFLALFPMQGAGHVRLVGALRHADPTHAPQWEDVSPHLLDRLDIRVRRVLWFSTYHVHHRVASHFQKGRVFLLGDAGHIHTPVGGQGMNTGIGDAVNLGWKLAEVLQGAMTPSLLQSFEPERIAFARKLVATTDAAFRFAASEGPVARLVRTRLVPALLPRLFARTWVQRLMFRTLSQIAIQYRRSPLSRRGPGPLQGGDRLPWLSSEILGDGDNFAPLGSRTWQVHVYGNEPAARDLRERPWPLHVFSWHPEMGARGLLRGAAYLIRPDGHVALISRQARAADIERYFKAWEA